MKSKNTAAALSIFLGGVGAHRFYLEQNGLGAVYLVFCWTFVPAVLGVVEGIRFLSMSGDDFYSRYNAPSLPASLPEKGRPAVPFLQPNINVVVNNAPGGAPTDDTADRITRLHELLEKGALTQEEFDREKARLLTPDPPS